MRKKDKFGTNTLVNKRANGNVFAFEGSIEGPLKVCFKLQILIEN